MSDFDDAEPALSIPDPSAKGDLVVDAHEKADLISVGCSIVDDDFVVEGAFRSNDGLALATITPDGLAQDRFGADSIQLIDRGAVIEPIIEDWLFSVSASWQTETSSGTLRIDCGDRLLDLSDIR